ncbi:MAG TPA: Uma2 family endonuclease [Bryobacteraceae bacterium]|nr:Uma2 family endonuclease [Bryobacteraceae bacterium]
MSATPKTYLTPEQYLEIERAAEFKSEYFQGEMFAMAGAKWAHNLLVGNLIASLHEQLRSRPCAVLPSDMRVRVSRSDLYTYPDVVVVCGEPKFLDDRRDTLLNPTVLIEVLSPSTEAYDRGRKFEQYRTIESLSEYLLVSSDRVQAELFTRQADGRWLLTAAGGMEGALEFQSVGCRIGLRDVYEKVDLTAA